MHCLMHECMHSLCLQNGLMCCQILASQNFRVCKLLAGQTSGWPVCAKFWGLSVSTGPNIFSRFIRKSANLQSSWIIRENYMHACTWLWLCMWIYNTPCMVVWNRRCHSYSTTLSQMPKTFSMKLNGVPWQFLLAQTVALVLTHMSLNLSGCNLCLRRTLYDIHVV
jgi:hypothetical protein